MFVTSACSRSVRNTLKRAVGLAPSAAARAARPMTAMATARAATAASTATAGRVAGTPLIGRTPLLPPARLQEGLSPGQTLIIYDGACGICQDFARLARRMDRAGKLALLPQQTPGLLTLVGLSAAEAERAAWALLPDGRLLEGAAAMAAVVDACAAWPWPLCRGLQGLPLLRPASELAYRLLAAHRHRLGRGSCDRPLRAAELDPALRWELERRRERAGWG